MSHDMAPGATTDTTPSVSPAGPHRLKIDIVSDVVCPWCAIGLNSLEIALQRAADVVQAELHFLPFQLNPDMPAEGADVVQYLASKYGMGAEQVRANQEVIAQRGRDVGFDFRMEKRGRTWNTLDAHRLLHWAGLQGRQVALKRALLSAYFTEGENPSDPAVLLRLVAAVGLDVPTARAILESDSHADAVREQIDRIRDLGINAVPAFIINDQHLIEGGQPPEYFERAFRRLAAAASA